MDHDTPATAPDSSYEPDLTLEDMFNEPAPAPSGLISLDDLLEESMVTVHAARAVKEGRAKLKDTRTTRKEREEIEAAIRRWELEREWKPIATVAMFQTQDCENCGYVQGIFTGLFQKEVHRYNRTTRWVVPAAVNSHLPIERKENLSAVPMCMACVEDLGYFEEDEDEIAEEIEASLLPHAAPKDEKKYDLSDYTAEEAPVVDGDLAVGDDGHEYYSSEGEE